jgi:hypothetical protein
VGGGAYPPGWPRITAAETPLPQAQ